MNRRKVLGTIATTSVVGVAGCASSEEDPEETGDNSQDNDREDFDTGIVFEGVISNLRDWNVDVVEGQIVSVEASEIREGERLQFQVGDGTSFVHSYNFYEEDSGTTNEYKIESAGQHQLQLNADRHEAPVNEDVEISARMEISEP